MPSNPSIVVNELKYKGYLNRQLFTHPISVHPSPIKMATLATFTHILFIALFVALSAITFAIPDHLDPERDRHEHHPAPRVPAAPRNTRGGYWSEGEWEGPDREGPERPERPDSPDRRDRRGRKRVELENGVPDF